MSIPQHLRSRSVYHFTYLANLKDILRHGLLSTNRKNEQNIGHTNIALPDIQDRRSQMEVPCGPGGCVHDYVPLYFCKRCEMLLSIIKRRIVDQQFIIHLEMPITIINEYDSVFTDAAANTLIPPNFYEDAADLTKLDWEAIDSLKWRLETEVSKQARMAELLVHGSIPIQSVNRIIVWNDSIKKIVQETFERAALTVPPIGVDDGFHYYTDFLDTGTRSIVTGPYFLRRGCQQTVDKIISAGTRGNPPRFRQLDDLLAALHSDLGSLPETAELVGLETENEVHLHDVGTHTLTVVQQLDNVQEYDALNGVDKSLVRLSAFLHDIGKGPKSRWARTGGRQRPDDDHPVKALPMLERILVEEVRLAEDAVRVVCKLVCYHDIIGHTTGEEECRIEELESVVETEREMDMLIALGKADIAATGYFSIRDAKIAEVRRRVLQSLANRAARS